MCVLPLSLSYQFCQVLFRSLTLFKLSMSKAKLLYNSHRDSAVPFAEPTASKEGKRPLGCPETTHIQTMPAYTKQEQMLQLSCRQPDLLATHQTSKNTASAAIPTSPQEKKLLCETSSQNSSSSTPFASNLAISSSFFFSCVLFFP